MEHLPIYIGLLFGITVALTAYLFYKATNTSKVFLVITVAWILIQVLLGLSGYFLFSKDTTPKLPLLVGPPTLLIFISFLVKRGRLFIDGLKIAELTLVHSVAILVELVLFLLFLYKYVPQSMTFEGGNFDLFSGLTAPVVYYFGFVKKKLSRTILITWNFICLALVINASVQAVISLPNFPNGAVGQPDIALGIFPFTLLPAVVVPLVLFAHLSSIRYLVIRRPSPNLVMN
ncbi:MAG TPA: hypothetical protein VFE53_22955 [Mucilaginibacter sp.]|jgi:hypothetical protein|nr:hypothetical protein [Mucilaginibacter sp.]